jgi:PAS domain S-box-containing protein
MESIHLIISGSVLLFCTLTIFLIRKQAKEQIERTRISGETDQHFLREFLSELSPSCGSREVWIQMAQACSKLLKNADWNIYTHDPESEATHLRMSQKHEIVGDWLPEQKEGNQHVPDPVLTSIQNGQMSFDFSSSKKSKRVFDKVKAAYIPMSSGKTVHAVIEIRSEDFNEKNMNMIETLSTICHIRLAEIQNENDRKDSHRHVETLMDVSPDFILVSDPAGRCTFANKSYLRFFGFDQDEFRRSKYLRSLNHEQYMEFIEHTSQIRPENPSISYFKVSTGARGMSQWTLWNETGVYDKEGNLVEFISVGRDISSLRKTDLEKEEELQELKDVLMRNKQDLRQPISQLLGAARMIDSGAEDPNDLRQISEFIKTCAKDLEEITMRIPNDGRKLRRA